LQQGNLAQAVALLQRMNLVAGQPFENLSAAGDLLLKMGHPAEAENFYSMRLKAVPWDADAQLKLAQAEAAANTRRSDAIQLLNALVTSPSAAYAKRASAAESLGALKASAPGQVSAELGWLVRGGPAAASESPGFYYARLRVARDAADPTAKIRLLLDAIAIRPEDFSQRTARSPSAEAVPESVSPRVDLAEVAAAANQNELAITATTPLLEQSLTLALPLVTQEGEAVQEASSQAEYPDTLWKWFLRDQKLSDERKSLLAAQLAGALVKLDRPAEAMRLWKIAAMLATDDSARSKANGELERAQAQIKLEKADQGRRPVISNRLEQSGLVRPRLLSHSGPTTEGGVGQ